MWLRNIILIALITFKEGIRDRILKASLLFALGLSGTNIFFTELFAWDLGKVSVEFGLSTISFFGLLYIFFLGMKHMARDLEQHKIYFIVCRPVEEWHYIIGKFLGFSFILLAISSILCLGVAGTVNYIMWQYPGFVPVGFTWPKFTIALGLQLLSLHIVIAITMFWSSFAKESFVAMFLSVSSYMIGQNMVLLRKVVLIGREESGLSISQTIVLTISWLFPNLSYFDLKLNAAYGQMPDISHTLVVCGYGIFYIGLLLFFATLFFKRRELV